MLQKIKIFILLITFTFLSISFVFLYGGNSKVYAQPSSTQLSVSCFNLGEAILHGGSSVSTNSPNQLITLTNVSNYSGTLPQSRWVNIYSIGGNNSTKSTYGNGIQNATCTYAHGTTWKYGGSPLNIPSGDVQLVYGSSNNNGPVMYWVDALPTPKPPKPIPTIGQLSSNPAKISGGSLIGTIFNDIFPILYGLVAVIVIALISYAGFLWMTSGGDTQKIARAKAILTGAVIGVSIIALAYAISLLAINLL